MSISLSEQQQRQLMLKIILSAGKLNTVSQKQPLIYSQIIKVFGIGISNNELRQNNESLYKLKQRLINICLQQKQLFLEYLSLPKFKQISQHALQLLKQSFQQISQLVRKQYENLKISSIQNNLSKFIPKLNSIQDIQNYHFKIFQLYCRSDLCPISKQLMENDRKYSEIHTKQSSKAYYDFEAKNYSNFIQSQSKQQNFIRYPSCWTSFQKINQVNSPNNNNLFSKNNQESINTKNNENFKDSRNISSSQSNLVQTNNNQYHSNTSLYIPKRQSSQFIEEYSPTVLKKQKLSQNSKLIQDYSQPLSSVSQRFTKIFTAVDPNFKKCLCKGNIQKVGGQYFSCQKCLYKYHYGCLKSDSKRQSKRKCPICVVEVVSNICYELIQPPLISSWIVYNRQNTIPHTIRFTQKLLNCMKSTFIKSNCQLYLKLITITKLEEVKNKQGKQNQKKYSKQRIYKKLRNKYTNQSSILVVDKQIQSNQQINQSQEEQKHEQNSMQNQSLQICEQQNISSPVKKVTENHSINESKQIQKASQIHTSIELTPQFVQNLSQCSSPILSLNFGLSSKSNSINQQVSKSLTLLEQKIIYYGIYEMRKKNIEEVINEIIEQNDLKKQIPNKSLEELLLNIIKAKDFDILSAKQLEKEVLKNQFNRQKQRKQGIIQFNLGSNYFTRSLLAKPIPIRFSKCRQISHILQLNDYVSSYYKNDFLYNKSSMQEKKTAISRGKPFVRLSPDISIFKCPLCQEQDTKLKLNNINCQNQNQQNNNRNDQINKENNHQIEEETLPQEIYIDHKFMEFLSQKHDQLIEVENKSENKSKNNKINQISECNQIKYVIKYKISGDKSATAQKLQIQQYQYSLRMQKSEIDSPIVQQKQEQQRLKQYCTNERIQQQNLKQSHKDQEQQHNQQKNQDTSFIHKANQSHFYNGVENQKQNANSLQKQNYNIQNQSQDIYKQNQLIQQELIPFRNKKNENTEKFNQNKKNINQNSISNGNNENNENNKNNKKDNLQNSQQINGQNSEKICQYRRVQQEIFMQQKYQNQRFNAEFGQNQSGKIQQEQENQKQTINRQKQQMEEQLTIKQNLLQKQAQEPQNQTGQDKNCDKSNQMPMDQEIDEQKNIKEQKQPQIV